MYKVSLLFFCINCAEVIIIYINIVIFSSFVSVYNTHKEEEKKKNNFIYYLANSTSHIWYCCFYGVFIGEKIVLIGVGRRMNSDFFLCAEVLRWRWYAAVAIDNLAIVLKDG